MGRGWESGAAAGGEMQGVMCKADGTAEDARMAVANMSFHKEVHVHNASRIQTSS